MGHTGIHCGVDGGVAHAGVDDGVSGKADGVVRQRRTSIGRSSVGRGSVVGGGIGDDSGSSRRNGGDWRMSGGGEGQSRDGGDQRRRQHGDGGIGSMSEGGGGFREEAAEGERGWVCNCTNPCWGSCSSRARATTSSLFNSRLATASEVAVVITGVGGNDDGGIRSVADVCGGLGEEAAEEERRRVCEIPQTHAGSVARAEREQPPAASLAAV